MTKKKPKMKEWMIDFSSDVVDAKTKKEAYEIGMQMIRDGEIEIDNVWEHRKGMIKCNRS